MKFFAILPALAVLATAVFGASVPASDCSGSELGCETHVPSKREFLDHPTRDGRALINARLLRRGLPLRDPVLRLGSPVRRTTPSSTPPTTHPTTYNGAIEVFDGNRSLLGYVSKDLGNGGSQFAYDSSLANALIVTFQANSTNISSQLDLNATNADPAWPYLGLVQGRDSWNSDLSPGSYKYLYLGGIDSRTQPGDAPQRVNNSYFIGSPRTAESSVWSFDPDSQILTPQWINTDRSSPDEDLWVQGTGLYVGGSKDAFSAQYPYPTISITFKFLAQ